MKSRIYEITHITGRLIDQYAWDPVYWCVERQANMKIWDSLRDRLLNKVGRQSWNALGETMKDYIEQ
jgi:hypothetical protein